MYVVYKDSETRTTFATKRMLKATEFCMIISNEIAKKTQNLYKLKLSLKSSSRGRI